MSDSGESMREIRINPIVPTASVLVATARGMRPKKADERVERDTRAVVETCPFCRGNEFDNCQDSYHWHLEICPRTSIPTGFELGSGLFVSTVSLELAAEALRNAEIDNEQ